MCARGHDSGSSRECQRIWCQWRLAGYGSMLRQDVVVGHAGNVVAYHDSEGLACSFFLIAGGELARVLHPVLEKLAHELFGGIFFRRKISAVIKIAVQKILDAATFFFYLGAEAGEPLRMLADILRVLDPGFVTPAGG